MMDDDDILSAFVKPPDDCHPATIFERLIELPEHAHFAEHDITVDFVLRVESKLKGGRRVLGAVMLPTVQGQLKDLFEQLLCAWLGRMPHFLVVLDQEFWLEANDVTREALIYHELCHVRQAVDKYGELRFDRDGNPVFDLVGHDIEEFKAVVRRYGRWSPDIEEFLRAADNID